MRPVFLQAVGCKQECEQNAEAKCKRSSACITECLQEVQISLGRGEREGGRDKEEVRK